MLMNSNTFCVWRKGLNFHVLYENFEERKDVTELLFQDHMKQCDKLGRLQASRSEGSKRAGEILIDKKRYCLSCMNRKGWVSKVSKETINP